MTSATPHIAVFIPNLIGAGAERYAVNLSRALHERGHRVDLVVGRAVGELVDEVAPGVRLVELGRSHNSSNLIRLARYLRSERPDALLPALIGANNISVLAARLSRAPTRVVISQHTGIKPSLQKGGWKNKLLAVLARWTYPRADAVVAVSNAVREDVLGFMRIDPGKVTVIYNPVVTADLKRRAEEPLTDPWFGPDQPPVVLGVGRLALHKNWDDLIRAFSEMRDTLACRLLIFGQGPEEENLVALADELGVSDDIRFGGQVPNPLPYMREAAAFALVSRFEGLPTVLIEALYVGTPIVATDSHGGGREILGGGEFGSLVPVGDIPAIRDRLVDVLTNPPSPPPADSWAPYSEDEVIDEYLRVLIGDRLA